MNAIDQPANLEAPGAALSGDPDGHLRGRLRVQGIGGPLLGVWFVVGSCGDSG